MKSNLFILTLFLFFATQTIVAQNLVPNPSFEDTIGWCPAGLGQMIYCDFWFCPSGTTSDYFKTCATTGNAGVPSNISGYQMARTGNAYCGIITNRLDTNNIGDWNEYIAVSLASPLIAGQAYQFKMYLNLANKSNHTIKSIGALLTDTIVTPFGLGYINKIPQITSSSNNFIISDKQNWMEFKQILIPDSAFQYLTIGNFNSTFNTSLYNTASSSGWVPGDLPYILIDDVSLIPINTICAGDSITLQTQGDSLYSWANSLNPSTIISTDSILTVSPAVNTIYYDYSNNDTTEYIVNVMQNGTNILGKDTNLCLGESYTLNAAISNSTYLWQDNSTNYNYEVTQPGIYWVQITNSCGAYTDTINITYNSIPVDLGNDKAICHGGSITLNTNLQNVEHLWQSSSTNPTFYVPWQQTPNHFYVEVRDSNSCGSDTVFIDYIPNLKSNFLGADTFCCEGQHIDISYNTPLVDHYLWSTGSTDSIISINSTGTYWLKFSNTCYTEYDTINVTVKPTPYFELGDDLELCEDEIITLKVNTIPNATIWWNNYTNKEQIVTEEGMYFASAHYQGCYYRDTINITYEDCKITLNTPNIFTPNNDGINDFFSIYGININSINIKVLNRWGQLVYESNDINDSWNGKTSENKDCPPGTYFYIINAKNEQNSKTFKGALTLLK